MGYIFTAAVRTDAGYDRVEGSHEVGVGGRGLVQVLSHLGLPTETCEGEIGARALVERIDAAGKGEDLVANYLGSIYLLALRADVVGGRRAVVSWC